MNHLLPVGSAICLLMVAATAFTVRAGELVGQVVSVHDGDTLTVLVDRRQVKVRLAETDAPELGQPFGTRSQQSLADLCAGVDANAEQVRRGLAWVYERYAPRRSPLYELQAEARGARRGLWSDPQPGAPWAWRSHH